MSSGRDSRYNGTMPWRSGTRQSMWQRWSISGNIHERVLPLGPEEDTNERLGRPAVGLVAGLLPAAARELLRASDLRFWWLSLLCLNLGSAVLLVAQAWLVLSLTSSAFALAVVSACSLLPQLLFTLLGGLVGDRFEKRTALQMIAALLVGSALALWGVVLVEAATIWHLAVGALSIGTWLALLQPISLSFARELVEPDRLRQAFALSLTTTYLGRALGPLVAGGLIAAIGVSETYLAAAVLFTGTLVGFGLIRRTGAPVEAGRGVLEDLGEAIGSLSHSPVLLPLWLLVAGLSLAVLPNLALIPLFATSVLDAGSFGLGALLAAVGVGQLAGAYIALFDHRWATRTGRIQVLGYIAQGLALWAFASSASVATSLVALLLFGLIHGFISPQANAIVQRVVAPAQASRIQSLFLLMFGLVPIGQIAVGWLAEVWGLATTIQATALGFTLLAVIALGVARELRALRHEPARRTS